MHKKRQRLTKLDLDFGFDVVNGVTALDFESNRLPGQGFHENLHDIGWYVIAIELKEEVRFLIDGKTDTGFMVSQLSSLDAYQ